jgi:hypothetical protein
LEELLGELESVGLGLRGVGAEKREEGRCTYVGCSEIPLALRAELDCYAWETEVGLGHVCGIDGGAAPGLLCHSKLS